jgi:Fe-S-cluster containining protein
MAAKRWFDKSLSFACTSCGRCCKSRNTRVYVNPSEVEELATHKSTTVPDFLHKYTSMVTDARGRVLTTLVGHPTLQQCVFLEGNKCSVYEARPTQCRTYPFWPQNLIGPAEWRAEAANCEGILLHEDISPEDEVVPEEIALNMIVHEIHDRGVGENWTAEASTELLMNIVEQGESPLEEYLDDFFVSNESRIGKKRRTAMSRYGHYTQVFCCTSFLQYTSLSQYESWTQSARSRTTLRRARLPSLCIHDVWSLSPPRNWRKRRCI